MVTVKALVVAGGGGGSTGGGGAGGLAYNSALEIEVDSYAVVVGDGGSGVKGNATPRPVNADNGGDTTFSGVTAIGGGGAGSAGVGGSSSVSGNGGTGLEYDISGINKYYAGGGGGNGFIAGGTSGTGGSSIGGDASDAGGDDGTANTGSGGGGASAAYTGGNGGSGIVIIRYETGQITATGGTRTTDGSDTMHTFTMNATFEIPRFGGSSSDMFLLF